MTYTKLKVLALSIFVLLAVCFQAFSQTGESKYMKVTINSGKKDISDLSPSFNIGTLSFINDNINRQFESNAGGKLRFHIINNGLNDIEELHVGIADINRVQGLSYDTSYTTGAIRTGDSLLVTIPVIANDSLQEGFALFRIRVTDARRQIKKYAQITVATKETADIPQFIWTNPVSTLERIDFPVYEISGTLKSKTRITGLKVYVNGTIPADRKTFTVMPTDNPDEYLIKRELTLDEGYNEVSIEARNDLGVFSSEPRVINYDIQLIDRAYAEKRIALVIGNAKYVNGNTLLNPVNDATAFSAALKELGFTVMTYLDADQKTMKQAIDKFGEQLNGFNVGLFYFAGHGIQVNGDNYLIPVDARLEVQQDVEYDCVNVGRLLGKMEAAGTATNIVILDACRDNPFERSWSGRGMTKGNGLAFMNAPSGSIIAYATSPGRTASDGTGKNGLYTSALLEFINIPSLPIEEFFKNVRREVEIKSNKQQTPWESTSLKGNFYFRLKN
jgi:hypothetical protein